MKPNIVIFKQNQNYLDWITDDLKKNYNISYFCTNVGLIDFIKMKQIKKIISYKSEITGISKDIDILYISESTQGEIDDIKRFLEMKN
jgi:hypothetical protein